MRSAPRVLLLLQATRGFDRGLLSGIARYASLNGPWTFYREPHAYFIPRRRTRIEELKTWQPDGAFCPISRLDLVRSLRVPVLAFDLNDYDGSVPGIQSEDFKAGQLAAEHLLGLGLDRFAFCGFETMRWSQARRTAFCQTIEEAGFRVHLYQPKRRQRFTWAREEPHVRDWLTTLPKPIGLFCANDDRAADVLETCRDLGYGVPEDVAVMGVDDDPYICDIANPPLTSVSMASDHAGYQGAELLHCMMRGEATMSGQRIVAPAAGVTARKSTDMLRTRDAHVRKALRFIRENAGRALQVKDVVRASGLSHRSLNDRFHHEFGSSILRQLTNNRVAHISRLLRETSLPVHAIARMAGFETDHHFSRYFKRVTGMTPQVYRKDHAMP